MTTPLLCVTIAFVLIYVPRVFVAIGQSRMPEGMDNKHPRDQQARLTGWAKRAQAAHDNSFESFAPFAAAVFVAHLAGGDPAVASTLAIAFVALRALYIGVYLANIDKVRSLVWTGGMACTVGLFLLPYFQG